MSVKSTLQIIKQADHPGRRGVTDGQTYQRLIGWPEVNETDRIRLGRATYAPGTYEQLHWHPIEACYYVIAGNATIIIGYVSIICRDLVNIIQWSLHPSPKSISAAERIMIFIVGSKKIFADYYKINVVLSFIICFGISELIVAEA